MKDWQVITADILNALDITTRIKLVMYIVQSDFIGIINSCINTFNWGKTDEGYEYWAELYYTQGFFTSAVEITKIRKFVQSLYPRKTYPEYYI